MPHLRNAGRRPGRHTLLAAASACGRLLTSCRRLKNLLCQLCAEISTKIICKMSSHTFVIEMISGLYEFRLTLLFFFLVRSLVD